MSPILRFLNLSARAIEGLNEWLGRVSAYLVVGLVLLVCYDVAMRYLFHAGSVALQELEWHLFALIFLLGAAYTLKHDDHVRVDIFYQSKWVGERGRAWINLLGGLFLLLPFAVLVIYSAWPFVMNAYDYGEGSPDPGGLPYRWLLKAAIPLAFVLLFLQGLVLIYRNACTLFCPKQDCREGRDGD